MKLKPTFFSLNVIKYNYRNTKHDYYEPDSIHMDDEGNIRSIL